MRISDWSSDVCSSDLRRRGAINADLLVIHGQPKCRHIVFPADHGADTAERCVEDRHGRPIAETPYQPLRSGRHQLAMLADQAGLSVEEQSGAIERSEEHTSELQSLMRISYAVLCLKKKTNTTHT